ncbi:MAG TPA: acyltransferase domain-containing protein [Acidimicrobiales bacterium]|nr:acyltransferase domain-containing protein [Acidimicrobiales bacterium]
MDAAAVRDALGLDGTFADWLDGLDTGAPDPPRAPLPDAATAARLLERVAVPAEDIPIVLAARPSTDAEQWIVDREHHLLVTTLGETGYLWWPPLHDAPARSTQLMHVWAFLAALPGVREWHAARGIPDGVSWATLADLGQNLYENQLINHDTGLDVPWWMTLHFRGGIYQLGRLQFERRTSRGDSALGVHIPETGPMTPDACDASIAWAHEFFPAHFPEETPVLATCASWLLDPQLADYLPTDSNIVRFQQRFTLRPDKTVADNSSICRFVFHDPDPDLDALPQDTTLQRAIVSHIKAGGTWQMGNGWFEW